MDFDILTTGIGIFYLVVLTLLEIVLGIDNIIFISIITNSLVKQDQSKARILGLSLALVIRLLLLSVVSWIMQLDQNFLFKGVEWLHYFPYTDEKITGHSLVLLIGGLFLIYKSVGEMHSSIKGAHTETKKKRKVRLGAVVLQIVAIDFIFSFDSVISAIGMTNDIRHETHGNPFVIIVLAVIISMIIMLIFSRPIANFINARPTIKMIALGFLVTIGVLLIAEAFGQHIPKGYIYFAMVYALLVEFLNIRMRKNNKEPEL
ncbi:TerC family protein [Fluviicola chungangensis]|uniref:TerC family protein n=1 Tax=Fluviicola chungangensis TaxID=2597671 RepID=A0A556MY10_9FLAO|nr:TerC family protein [Fluviicola chungangensis]TSJ44804.1 TerC family protein [Fluviicola chungangensis]